MKTDQQNLMLYAFNNSNKQFVIPVYQRNYDWGTDNCSVLFDDIMSAIGENHYHFLGTFVECLQVGTTQGIGSTIIVDGQQRLTTLYIFLKALFDLTSDNADIKTLKHYLFNDTEYLSLEDQMKFKLKLKEVKTDQCQLEMLMNDDFDNIDKSSNIWINYSFFKDAINRELNDNHMIVGDFLRGLNLLQIVVISLQEPNDDPQVVFERINSTGVPLELSDLIRNYLLMTDINMDNLFEQYWSPMEERVGKTNLNDFVLEYIYFKIPGDFNEHTAYKAFKNYMNQSNLSHTDVLIEMEKCSKYFALYLGCYQGNYSANVINLMRDLKICDNKTINPLLFSVFNDFDSHVIDEKTLAKILKFLISYLVRRTIVDVPTNSMRGFFISAYKRTFGAGNVPTNENYYQSFVNFFLSLNQKNNYDRLISDDYVIDSLINKPLYRSGKTQFCKFILASLENRSDNNNEMVVIDSRITIEHIMPQTLDKDGWWLEEIGYDRLFHESYVHRLGNLSLTGVNSKLSNEPFDFKKNIYTNTHFNYLYEDVLSESGWGRDQIEQRGNRLAARVVEIFPLPEGVTNDMVEGATEEIQDNLIETHSLSEDKFDYTNTRLISIIFDETEYQINHMIDILETVCSNLYSKNPTRFNDIIRSLEKDLEDKKQKPFVSYIRSKLRQPREIKNTSLFFETNLNSNAVVGDVRKIFDYFDIDYDALTITISKQNG